MQASVQVVHRMGSTDLRVGPIKQKTQAPTVFHEKSL